MKSQVTQLSEAFLKQYFTSIQELYFPILVKKCELNILKLFPRHVPPKAALTYTVFLLYKLY